MWDNEQCALSGICKINAGSLLRQEHVGLMSNALQFAGFRPRGRPGDELPDSCKLYVGSLPDSVTDDTLRAEFSKFGEVLHAIVLKDMATQMVS